MTTERSDSAPPPAKAARLLLLRVTIWALAAGCFALVFSKIGIAAARDGLSTLAYLALFFDEANWLGWIALMIPYSCFFFIVDAHATWRVVRWFNAPTFEFRRMLPIRASAYILSLVNEQIGKGAIVAYLWRRYQVPAWQALSSMALLGMVEIYQLLLFSAVGTALYFNLVRAASTVLPLAEILITVFAVAAVYFPLHVAYFRGTLLPHSTLRERQILRAFRLASLRHYALIVVFKAPNLLGAVLVYSFALQLFNVDVGFGQMLAFLPVIFLAAALPLPFHAGALLLWTVLFPDYPEVGVFSLVMHTFFVLFNAVIGVLFLPLANRELFSTEARPEASGL
ncbi:MAG: hypothetical protein EXR86_05750 [Gammaproteobacteria bacterium]|nr:hypothetical protein [Gammaproteobacteria bacterium]